VNNNHFVHPSIHLFQMYNFFFFSHIFSRQKKHWKMPSSFVVIFQEEFLKCQPHLLHFFEPKVIFIWDLKDRKWVQLVTQSYSKKKKKSAKSRFLVAPGNLKKCSILSVSSSFPWLIEIPHSEQ
jgi:hypothetical protein